MKKALEMTQERFESSSVKTAQYLEWHKLFKKEFTQYLIEKGIVNIHIGKPNHFDMSGFFQRPTEQIYYFSMGDIRWNKKNMLIRTAKDYKDYTGGSNCYVSLLNIEDFDKGFSEIVK